MLSLHAFSADKPTIEQATLTDSPTITWEGKKQATLDALRIKEDASIKLESCSDITITACDLHSIELINCDRITIRNCWLHDSALVAVAVGASRQVVLEGCRIENVMSGAYAVDSKAIQVIGNFTRNVKGLLPRGQMVQFDNVTGPGNIVRGNYAINEQGKSHPEDVINLYMSSGEEKSPIIVEDNYLVGDPVKGSEGKSESGSGIMLADCGGAHEVCRHNVIISAGQVGIGVAGGHHIQVEDNLIYGLKSNVSNVGLYVWNQSNKPSEKVSIARNRVEWTNKDGEAASWWDGGNVKNVEERDNRFYDSTLAAELPGPPSVAPMPPHPWTTTRADGTVVVRLPWKP